MAVNKGISREISLTSGEDFPIKISLESLQDHFNCPVCKGTVYQCTFTACGHRYCRECIVEWVGRSHECPVCREPLSTNDLVSDRLYDELLETILKQKEKEEQEYLKQAALKTSDLAFKEHDNELVSPLESILRKHLKRTLQAHEEYHQQLILECKKSQARAYKEKAMKIDKVIRTYPHDPDHPERIQMMKKIEVDWDEKKKSLEDELAKIQTLLASTYDRYLEKNLPSPSTLPVSVLVTIPQKNISFDNFIIKPSDTMENILLKLKELMKEDNIEVAVFPPCEALQISLLSPFAAEKDIVDEGLDGGAAMPYKPDEWKGDGSDGGSEGLTSLVNTTLHSDCRPVMEYGLKSGCEIRIEGKIILEGEQPRVCFAASFVEGQSKCIDYYACKSCNNTTWICQYCADACHKEHELIPHRMNHLSKWACCYCKRKTNQCRIFMKLDE